MNEADISRAFEEHLKALSGAPTIVWENKDKPAAVTRPYLTVQMVRVGRRALDLAGGGGIIASGYLQVTIVHELDVWAYPAEQLADSIAAHFKKGTSLERNGGKVVVTDAPNILTALRDGPDWRVPVQIDYRAS